MVKNFKWLVIPAGLILAGCGGGTVTVPLTVQSDPLGSYVVYTLPPGPEGGSADWIFLGQTPLDLKQIVDEDELQKARAFRIKVFKDGYNDQVRDWSEDEIEQAIDEKGHIFWNPKLVPGGG